MRCINRQGQGIRWKEEKPENRCKMSVQLLLVHISLIMMTLWSSSLILRVSSSSPSFPIAKRHCQPRCGDIEIPYPFGIGSNCYSNTSQYDPGFQIVCDTSTSPPKPFLNLTDSRPEVLEISLDDMTIKIKGPITFSDCPGKKNHRQPPNLSVTPFWFSKKNMFTSVSCGRIASLTSDDATVAVCLSICNESSGILVNNSCGGINCCQTTIPDSSYGYTDSSFTTSFTNPDGYEKACVYAFLVDEEWFTSKSTNTSAIPEMDDVPVVFDWRMYTPDNSTLNIMNGICEYSDADISWYKCSCSKGYKGNPYLVGGCQDIDECQHPNICGSGKICSNSDGSFECYTPQPQTEPVKGSRTLRIIIVLCSVIGILLVDIGTWRLHKIMMKRRNSMRNQRFFKLNGGLLLEQQLSSGEVTVEKIQVFNAYDLEKATDRFNVDRILGEGGQGTVYKGMLADGRIVAVKKSKKVNGGEVSQFINEIVILSQINHRNVVKLLGCCLEIEVPLLVYEFLPNGTLSQYIHSRDEDFPLTWEMRLRVAIDVAGALSYLHSSASMAIYHRDIKSSNILLDDKYRAKVADFGTSRSGSIDKTHLTMTHVNGTFGYLDPEYFRSSQFTDKSDVYSFGIVLAELLTGQKPVSVTRSPEGRQNVRSLATYFIASMEEDRMFDILDIEVLKGGKEKEIMEVANFVKRCLNMKGKKRPTMKEIAAELEGILTSSKSSDVEEIGDVEDVENIAEAWYIVSTSTGSDIETGSSLDAQPILSFKSH